MNFEFLSPGAATSGGGFVPVARSPMERQARAAGARFEVRDGWSVAVDYPGEPSETGWVDVSHLRKFEVRGDAELPLGHATRVRDAWWCPLTADRALVIGDEALGGVEVTTAYAALALIGPRARDIIARFSAADLRDRVAPVGAFLPVSVARTPGLILREAEDRFLILFGAAYGQYMWTVVADAGRHLGATPIGEKVRSHA